MLSTSRIISRALALAIAINVALGVTHLVLAHELSTHGRGETLALRSGVTVTGERWSGVPSAPCHILRMTSDNCEFCKDDEVAYARLRAAAARSHCQVVEVAPTAGMLTEDAREGVVQLRYIDHDLGTLIEPFITPHTIILDSEQSVKWMRRGTFDQSALTEAIAEIDALARIL